MLSSSISTNSSITFVAHAPILQSRYRKAPNFLVTRKRPRAPQFSCSKPPERNISLDTSEESQHPTKQNVQRDILTQHNSSPPQQSHPSNGVSDSDNSGAPVEASPDSDVVQIGIAGFNVSVPARWLLYAVPFFWGSFGPAVRLLFSQDPHPIASVFNSERLLMSSLVYLPVLFSEIDVFRKGRLNEEEHEKSIKEGRFNFVKAGTELGVYVFLANVAQVIGLQQTSASRAAFLVQLQTVIVPVLSGLFGLGKVSGKTWLSSIVAVAGVALLSSDKGHGAASSLTGDVLEIVSAFFFSTYIIRLGSYCNNVAATPLVATKIIVQTILSFGWAAAVEIGTVLNHHTPTDVSSGADDVVPWTAIAIAVNILVVAWTGLLSSAASGWAQTKGQQVVPASEAVVIFSTQPLWASALAALVLGESFGPKGFAGGAMIVAATLIASRPSDTDEEEDSAQ